jgi:hypothetical protein
MRSFGEMAIIARHSDKKVRNKLADRGNTVMFIGYSDTLEKDVMSRDVIRLNKTYSAKWICIQ